MESDNSWRYYPAMVENGFIYALEPFRYCGERIHPVRFGESVRLQST